MPTWTFNLRPAPASRPKVSRYGTYYSKNYTKFRKAAALEIPKFFSNHEPYDESQSLHVTLKVYVPKPKSGSDRAWPRGDVDNYAKGVLDSCNGIVWDDDDSITKLTVEKVWGDPKVVMKVQVRR